MVALKALQATQSWNLGKHGAGVIRQWTRGGSVPGCVSGGSFIGRPAFPETKLPRVAVQRPCSQQHPGLIVMEQVLERGPAVSFTIAANSEAM